MNNLATSDRVSTSQARKEQNRSSSQRYRARRSRKLALLNQFLEVQTYNGPQAASQTPLPQTFGQQGTDAPLSLAEWDPLASFGICERLQLATASSQYPIYDRWLSEAANLPLVYPFIAAPSDGSSSERHPEVPNVADFESHSDMQGPCIGPCVPEANMPPDQVSQITYRLSFLSQQEKLRILEYLSQDIQSGHQFPLLQASLPSAYQSQVPGYGLSQPTPLPSQPSPFDIDATRFQAWLQNRTEVPTAFDPLSRWTFVHLCQLSFWDALIINAGVTQLAAQELGKQDGRSSFVINYTDAQKVPWSCSKENVPLPPDLRPVDAQLKHPHHPYLDLIPFPLFRHHIISALSQNPQCVDWKQVCSDINAGGMVCWAGETSTNAASQMPWASRSWEPKVWFLRRYWFLVGGWDDEMWVSARWWAHVRNEIITYT